MRHPRHSALLLAFFLSLVLASRARADWSRVLPGPIERVVANESHAAALRNGQVWLLRDDGSVVGRVAQRPGDTAKVELRASQREAEEILDRLDVADSDREEDWAIDLVYDERTLDQRKRARPRPPALSPLPAAPPSLAAGGGNIWIASNAGLLRIGPDGRVVRERGHGEIRGQWMASGPWLAAASPAGLLVLSKETSEHRVLPIPGQANKVALSSSGHRWGFTTTTGIAWMGDASDQGSFELPSPVLDLIYCGEDLVTLLPDSLLVRSPHEAPAARNQGLAARRIFCPEGDAVPWMAIGNALQVSVDRGRQWQTVDTPAGIEMVAVAATARHLWLASDKGLYRSSDGAGAPGPAGATEQNPLPPKRHRRGTGSWFSWLPKVSLRASAVVAPDGRELEAFAYATIPLDPRRLPILSAGLDEATAAEPMPRRSLPPERILQLGDPDRDCLPLARRKAVELAMSEPERAASFVARAGRAAWLPELRILVARRYGRSESLDIASSSTALSSPLGIDTVNDIRYEARATWDLARLVFSSEELAAQNQALHMAELRRDIESTVNRLYFERRRLASDAAAPEAASRRLRVGEIEAELDSLSSGAFGACVTGKSLQ